MNYLFSPTQCFSLHIFFCTCFFLVQKALLISQFICSVNFYSYFKTFFRHSFFLKHAFLQNKLTPSVYISSISCIQPAIYITYYMCLYVYLPYWNIYSLMISGTLLNSFVCVQYLIRANKCRSQRVRCRAMVQRSSYMITRKSSMSFKSKVSENKVIKIEFQNIKTVGDKEKQKLSE